MMEVADRYPLVPVPRRLEAREGDFVVDAATRIYLSDPASSELRRLADFWADPLRTATGFPLSISGEEAGRAGPNAVVIRLEPPEEPGTARGGTAQGTPGEWQTAALTGDFTPERRSREAYRLRIESDRVTLDAGAPVGIFYGLQTLRQLLPPEVERAWGEAPLTLPNVSIQDEPRFAYRGMHLDVGRHLFPVEFVKRYIDLLALYKMNVFHWHLTEDQGWRIEILKYPKLTEVGAYRQETILERNFDPYIGDGVPYGGFYTQEEVREVVAYAAERHITVIPEIEMPGHSVAALAAYPELGCTPGPFEVSTVWGVKDDIYCPSEETFAFLEDVLTEVMELFPGPYIHIGGDEAPKTAWEESALAQEVIRREGLADEHELQSYFVRRIEGFLNEHGRRLVGWDEILEGGLAPQATVMSWRGMDGGIEAARQGHDVIMTPTSHAYFDYYQGERALEPLAIGGFLPLEKVYSLEPVPAELSSAEALHILGAQGNVWTEYIKTADHVEYMAFPRMLAMSEVVWSPAEVRDWSSFTWRLGSQLRRLDFLGVNYRTPTSWLLRPTGRK
jgi:hexosaminidase